MSNNVDRLELEKFSQLANDWWNTKGAFKPLHDINPLRLEFIENLSGTLNGKKIVDVGCGGGIFAESMAARGAAVLGIDLAEKALKIAQLHSIDSGISVEYRCISAEALSLEAAHSFDIVTCMEMLEHVPNPASIVKSCAQLVKPGGKVYFSTLNRNLKSYLFAIVGAEYLLNLLPRGTHDYARFLKPSELTQYVRESGLTTLSLRGINYQLLTQKYTLSEDTAINYLLAAQLDF